MNSFFSFWIICIIVTLMIARERGLGVVEYMVLAFFLGPLAVIIALVSNPQRKGSYVTGKFTLEDAKQQVNDIKDELFLLKSKAKALEERISEIENVEGMTKAVSLNKTEEIEVSVEKPVGLETAPSKEISDESFEFVFGKYWLNRIGVVLFVLGIGYFISYTFQYMNALAKIGVGYVFSAVFFYWGLKLKGKEKYMKLSAGIFGGAWGLLYLSTYATHFFEATRVIQSEAVTIILLALVSAAAVLYNLRYGSWVVTAITYSLAFITVLLGSLSYGMVAYYVLIIGSVAYLSLKKQWFGLLIAGIAASFLTAVICEESSIMSAGIYWTTSMKHVFRFNLIFTMMTLSWLAFSYVLFQLKEKDTEGHSLSLTAQMLNAGLFIYLGLDQITRANKYLMTALDERFWFLIILAFAYFIYAFVYKKLGRPKHIVANMAIAFVLLAFSAYIKAPELGLSYYWAIESAALFVIGIYYREQFYRLLAALLSVFLLFRLYLIDLISVKSYLVAGISIPHNILIVIFAAVGFYYLGTVARGIKTKGELIEDEFKLYSIAYPVMATILMVLLIGEEAASRWLSLGWTLLGVTVLAAGFMVRDKILRYCALSVLTLTCLRVILIDMSKVNTIYKIIVFILLGAVMLIISMVYSNCKIKNKE